MRFILLRRFSLSKTHCSLNSFISHNSLNAFDTNVRRTCCKQQIEFSGHVSFFTVYRKPAPPIIMSSIGKFLDTATGWIYDSLLWNQLCHHALVLPRQTFMLSIGPTQPTFFDVFIDYTHITYCHPFPRRADLLALLWPHLILRRNPCLLTIPMGNHQCRSQVHTL